MSPVRYVVIPCGGRGTRMLALTHGAPKELISVGGIPVLQHVLHECALSGVMSAVIVVSPEKGAIAEFARPLAGRNGMPANIALVVQPAPLGLADAIRCARDVVRSEPFAVALPDNLFVGGEPAVAQVIATFAATGKNVVGVTEISANDASARGPTPVYPGVRDGDLLHIESIPPKGAHGATFDAGDAQSPVTGVGRYVFDASVLPLIDEIEPTLPAGAELDDIPVLQELLARGRLVGRILSGRFLDVGLPEGFREANSIPELFVGRVGRG